MWEIVTGFNPQRQTCIFVSTWVDIIQFWWQQQQIRMSGLKKALLLDNKCDLEEEAIPGNLPGRVGGLEKL